MAVGAFIEDLRDHLAAITSIGLIAGETLFLGDWPDSNVYATLIRETGGTIVDHTMVDRDANGFVAKHFEDVEVQIVSRSGHYDKAFLQQRKIGLVLMGRNRFQMGTYYVWGVAQMAPPQMVEVGNRTESDVYLVSTNYQFLVRDDSAL